MNDRLERLLFLQQTLQEDKMGIIFPIESPEKIASLVKQHYAYMNVEFAEVLQELPYFKEWKDYSAMTPKDLDDAMLKVRKEYVDALHFFLNIGLFIGLDAEEMFSRYCVKNNINRVRQDEGYAWKKEGAVDVG